MHRSYKLRTPVTIGSIPLRTSFALLVPHPGAPQMPPVLTPAAEDGSSKDGVPGPNGFHMPSAPPFASLYPELRKIAAVCLECVYDILLSGHSNVTAEMAVA